MAKDLMSMLGNVYGRLPRAWRPGLKRTFLWGSVRAQALAGRQSVERGQRVEFLDFEIAHLEPTEFIGPGPMEVLVDSSFSCVSPGTESAVLRGLPGARRSFPYAPGYSVCGTVAAVGRARRDIKPGDLVAGRMPHASRGVMGPASLFKVPAGVTADEACWIELGIITLQGVRKARIRPGDRVAVIGQGLIGQLAVRLARLGGADPIVAVATSRRRMKSAVAAGGADEFVALAEDPVAIERVNADIVIEAVGSARAIVTAMRASRPGGTVILLGSSRDLGRDLDWWTLAQQRQVMLVGAHIGAIPARDASAGRWTYEQEGRLFLDLLAAKRLSVADLITWRPSPTECNAVYEVLAAGGREHVGIVFDWRSVRGSAGPKETEVGRQ